MADISIMHYSSYDCKSPENKLFGVRRRGAASAFSAAYPADNSIGISACERAVTVSTNSFVQRPSMRDEAAEAITGFVNEGIYGMQEPGKNVFCSTAALYIFRNKARWTVSGNAKIYYFADGKLQSVSEGNEDVILGKRLNLHCKFEPPFELQKGVNSFLIISGADNIAIDAAVLEKELAASSDAAEWTERISPELKKQRCTALAVILPKKKFRLFGK
ncbi:MAG: hypothetical protein ACI4J0_10390 [Huintestinicola sp.]|uniref:hypothetical protein n=1 Tax=Huintestinicola sp. TaxID=2981661 RepID=UPI003F0241EF